jgi:hypothetical protein
MDEGDQLAEAAALLLRYEIAKAAVYRPGQDFALPSIAALADAIARANGEAVVHGCLHVMTWMAPPLVGDYAAPDFFRAVVWEEDEMIDLDPEPLDALRRYVLKGSPGHFLRLFGDNICLRLFTAGQGYTVAET